MNITETQQITNEEGQLPENLRALLQNSNLTPNQVAEALDLPLMTIRRLMNGETADPRFSTLKLIADHFNITVDALVNGDQQLLSNQIKTVKPQFVPLLDWETAAKIESPKELDLQTWREWQPVSLENNLLLGKNAFALESRPSMYPRFPQGAVFIFDPDLSPKDGDIVLIKIKESQELTLRELTIDPPEWRLHPIVPGSNSLLFSENNHAIKGINLMTLLYNRRN